MFSEQLEKEKKLFSDFFFPLEVVPPLRNDGKEGGAVSSLSAGSGGRRCPPHPVPCPHKSLKEIPNLGVTVELLTSPPTRSPWFPQGWGWMSQLRGGLSTSGSRFSQSPPRSGLGRGVQDSIPPRGVSGRWILGYPASGKQRLGHNREAGKSCTHPSSCPAFQQVRWCFSWQTERSGDPGNPAAIPTPSPSPRDATFWHQPGTRCLFSIWAKQEMSQAGKHGLTRGIALGGLGKRPPWRRLLFLGKEETSGHRSLRCRGGCGLAGKG